MPMPTMDTPLTPFSKSVLHILQRWTLVAMLSVALILQGALPVCAALFGSFGIKDEQELGRKFDVMVRARLPLVEDPEIKLYVKSIVERLEKDIPPQPFPFTSNVLLHNSLNAFAVPGGYVFVNTGLIMQLEHESELAGVIAHELAHVTQRHVATRMERAQLTTIASLLGALAGAFLGGNNSGGLVAGSLAAGQSAMLNYSRADETESDQIGLQYLIKAGYKPQGMTGAFEKIRKRQWSSGLSIPEYLSTHPDVSTRVNEINARVKSLPVTIQNRPYNDNRFKRVQTLIWARYGDTEVAHRRFAAAPKNDCLALMGQGIIADRRNQVGEASAAFDRALTCAPKDALIHREAGAFYFSKGDPRASQLLRQALALDPDDAMAQFYYARLLSDTGNRAEAHNYFEKILRYVPEDSEIHYYYGRSLGESKQTFLAYLHLSYSALYQNDRKKTESWLAKARTAATLPEQKKRLEQFDEIYKERRAYWR